MRTLTLVLLVFGFGALQAAPEYIFTFPSNLEAGEDTSFCLSARYIDIEDWLPGDAYDVVVYLTLVKSDMEEGIVNGTGAQISGITTPEFSNCPTIRAPDKPGNYKVEVSASTLFQDKVQDIFHAKNSITVHKPKLITLIQTDKPVYKPGQTVKFRAMTMDYQLMAKDFGYSEIFITAPNRDRAAQWKDVKTQNGLVSLEMLLIDEPILGEWKITAVFEEGEEETTFKVEEYVLPKFEVTITPPSYLLPTSPTIEIEVCAKYTFGKPVKGSMKMTMCRGQPYYEDRPCVSQFTPEFDGCYTLYTKSSLVKLDEARYSYYGPLTINATVTDGTNGVEQHGESTGPYLSRTVFNMKFEDDSSNYYKPAFPYKGRLVITDTDGSPAIGEMVKITAESFYDDFWPGFYYAPRLRNELKYKWTGTFESDVNGIVHFVITDVPPSVGYLSLTAHPNNTKGDPRFRFDSKRGTLLTTIRPQGDASIRRWHSTSNSYIYIPDVNQKVMCGSQLELDVYYTTPEATTYKFQTMVKAGDRIVSTQAKEVTFDGISHFNVIAIRPEQLLIRDVVTPPPPPEPTSTDIPMEKRSVEEAEPVNEELIIPEKASLLGNEEIDEGDPPPFEEEVHLIGHFKLMVDVTHDMSPDASVLVYYMRDDGEIIASSVKFNIEPCFRNKVDMYFQEKTLLPGSEAVFTLKASPSSTCFVGMVDKSINLLGGQNQITPTQVFEKVRKVSREYRWSGGSWGGDYDYCRRKYPELLSGGGYYHLTTIGVDASKSFKVSIINYPVCGSCAEAAYLMKVKFDMMKSKYAAFTQLSKVNYLSIPDCKERNDCCHIDFYQMKDGCDRGHTHTTRFDSPKDARPLPLYNEGGMPGLAGQSGRTLDFLETAEEAEVVDEETVPEPERIRSLFPETWLWDIYPVGEEGESILTTTIPDTITEWVGNSLCTNPVDGVGVSELTSIKGFKPFFVSLTLPYAAVRGETLIVPVTVYNYLEKCIRLDLRFEEDETFQLPGKTTERFCLCGSETKTVKFKITPVIIGEIELLVKAVSIKDNGACTNFIMTEDYVGVSDGVQRTLLVEPEGIPQEKTISEYVCVSENTPDTMSVSFNLPRDLIQDSERAYVSVVGDIMGPTLSNLKNLLRMPYGCGEQNMASWAPNIYVLQYLTNTGQLTHKIEEEAKGYMRVGYQRQMKYRHSDSSYSAFGESSNNNPGSIWLTAFVIKSMAQSSQFVSILEDDIGRSVRWIIEQQNEDGCFPQVGKVFSSYMKGGLSSGENPAGLTAFIMIALMEAGIGNIAKQEYYQMGIRKGLNCLKDVDPRQVDTYTLAVMTYTFSISGLQYETELLMRYLEERKVSESGLEYWKRETLEEEEKGYWWRYSSAEVEMTAYAALAKMMYGMEDAIGDTQPIIQWLTKQRNPYGGFSSTQDTVIALQALAMFGNFTYSGDSNLNIQISNSRVNEVISVTPDNLLLTQIERVEPKHGPLTITSSGEGCALIQVSTRYSILEEEKKKRKPFTLEQAEYLSIKEKNNCAKKALRICTRYKLSGSSNMAIIEVKMQTGWEPVADSIKELQDNGLIARFEVDKNYVQLYFDEITSEKKCVVFEVEETMEIANAKEALIRVYDYYETDLSVSKKYILQPRCKRSEDDEEKTPTKEDIPPNNEGLNCTIMQCRVLEPPVFVPKGCPKCVDTITNATLKKAICDSQRIYKATVGRKGAYKIKLMTNFTSPKKTAIGHFVNPEMGDNCKCSVLEYKNKKAFILTIPQTWEIASNQEVIKLGMETLIVKQSKIVHKTINYVKNREHFCNKMERRRRSRARKNRRRSGVSSRQI